MFMKETMVNNQVGLHARPATFFIQKANEFKSSNAAIDPRRRGETLDQAEFVRLGLALLAHGGSLVAAAGL